MRLFLCVIVAGACLADASTASFADTQGYCRAYARNEANTHLAGRAIIDTSLGPEVSKQDWAEWNKRAFADCMAQYEVETAAAAPAAPAEPTERTERTEPEAAAAVVAAPSQAGPVKKARAKPKPVDVKIADVKSVSARTDNDKPLNQLLSRTKRALTTTKSTGLVPRSAAWNEFCAKKYVSFDPATGTYKSYGGQRRTCVAPKPKPAA